MESSLKTSCFFLGFGAFILLSLKGFKKLSNPAIQILSLLGFGASLSIQYNFFTHFAEFCSIKYVINKNLSFKNESIFHINARLFLKSCLIEDELIKLGKVTPLPWSKSFFLDQVFGAALGKIVLKLNNLA